MEIEKLISKFREIGFNLNESKIYFTLLKHHILTAGEIASQSKVPRPKVYEILNGLLEKGFCSSIPGKVLKYKALNPQDSMNFFIQKRDKEQKRIENIAIELSMELQEVYENINYEQHPLDYIEILKDNKKIENRFLQYENQVKDEILLFVKSPFAIHPLKKGMINFDKVKAVCEKKDLQNKNVVEFLNEIISHRGIVKVTEKLPVKLVVFDRKITLLNIQDYKEEEKITTMIINHNDFTSLMINSFFKIYDEGENIASLKIENH